MLETARWRLTIILLPQINAKQRIASETTAMSIVVIPAPEMFALMLITEPKAPMNTANRGTMIFCRYIMFLIRKSLKPMERYWAIVD